MTSRDKVEAALEKIKTIDQAGYLLNSVLAIREQALADADAYDRAGIVLPMGGEPILVKDNVEALGLPGTAGSLALEDTPPVKDATIVANLKAAGAIVIGATNLSEWANIRSTKSTSGWSAVGGLTANPWIHKHSAGGSSSGSGAAVGAGLVDFAVGSETDGSITCPASLNGCVGLKPSVGLTSREGVIPISGSQDSPGVLTRTVAQAALMLEAMSGQTGYVGALKEERSLRIGFVKNWMTSDDETCNRMQEALDAISKLAKPGGIGIELFDVDLKNPESSVGDDEYAVLKHELVSDLGKYLKTRAGSRVHSLEQVQAFNIAHRDTEMQFFQQEIFDEALQIGGRGPEHQIKHERNLAWANQTLAAGLQEVDLLIGCTYGPAWESKLGEGDDYTGSSWITLAPSIAGAPIGTVPMGLVRGLPVGLGVVGARNSEAVILHFMQVVENILGQKENLPTFQR
jgi:amidase